MAGGVFIRFQVGGTGNSVAHLRYISRLAAVRDGRQGVLLHNLPEAAQETSFILLRDHLLAYAWLREQSERRSGHGRSFYHAVLGFERNIESNRALWMIGQWLETAFPRAQAAAFLHRDTPHLHAHVWINARDNGGRKLQLGYRTFRSLDEVWNRFYAQAMGRDMEDHLTKKNETRLAKRLSLAPSRLSCIPERSWYRRQELRDAGQDELEKSGSGGTESTTACRIADASARQQDAPPGESPAHRGAAIADDAEREANRALSETHGLRKDAANLASREAVKQAIRDTGERER